MAKIDVHTVEGTKEGTVTAPAIFSVTPKKELLHQAVVAYLANQRTNTAHTKTRGEVAGGGRKPWKQKGTGRARAGSSRSPIWIGGGVTFGPRNTANYQKALPSRMRKLALAMALSTKLADKKVIVAEEFIVKEPKTKLVNQLVQKLTPEATSVLIIVDTADQTLLQASRNLPYVTIQSVNHLNTYDVLRFDYLIFTKKALQLLDSPKAAEK